MPELGGFRAGGAFPLDDRGLWCDVRVPPGPGAPRPALFLDRDGTLVEERGYLGRPEDVALVAGAARVVARCNALGVPAVVVTNQSAIERGLFGWPEFAAVERAIAAALAAAGARLDAVFACPSAGTDPEPFGRKPHPGMLERAAELLRIDLARSWIAGDSLRDVEAGRRAGLARGWLLAAADDAAAAARALSGPGFEVVAGASLERLADALAALGDPPGAAADGR